MILIGGALAVAGLVAYMWYQNRQDAESTSYSGVDPIQSYQNGSDPYGGVK